MRRDPTVDGRPGLGPRGAGGVAAAAPGGITVRRAPWLGTAILTLVATLTAAPAASWTSGTQRAIAETAGKIAPPDLARQIEKHRRSLVEGSLEPFRDGRPALHLLEPGGELAENLAAETAQAIRAIELHRPFEEVVYRLGRLSHWAADANQPLNVSSADPRERTYFADFAHYAESAQDRFSVVFYAEGRDLAGPRPVEGLLERTRRRGLALYPMIGREYLRVGRVDGRRLFDDRSTAFGVAALAYSHAVSDAAALFRYVWLEAGGADPRTLPFGGAAPDSRTRGRRP